MFRKTKTFLGAAALLAVSTQAHAAVIDVGVAGFAAETNNWPDGEPPEAAIDGQGQKYLNFGEFNTGVLVTPTISGTIALSMTLTTANDAVPRDPSSYVIMGITGATTLDTNDYTLISTGGLALPDTRNVGGVAALDPANQQTINFAGNTNAFDSYLIYFPTVKDAGLANSMQIAEIQLFDAAGPIFAPGDTILGVQVPEPSTGLLGLLALGGLGLRRRR